jgi:hypothetical protein
MFLSSPSSYQHLHIGKMCTRAEYIEFCTRPVHLLWPARDAIEKVGKREHARGKERGKNHPHGGAGDCVFIGGRVATRREVGGCGENRSKMKKYAAFTVNHANKRRAAVCLWALVKFIHTLSHLQKRRVSGWLREEEECATASQPGVCS